MDTVLNNFGYGVAKAGLTATETARLKKAATVVASQPGMERVLGYNPNTPFTLMKESATRLYVPRNLGVALYGPPKAVVFPAESAASSYRPSKPNAWDFKGSLRPHQSSAVAAYLASPTRDGLLNLPCGQGKTCTALHIASRLQTDPSIRLNKPVLVIVNEEDLGQQWKDRIGHFLPNAAVGWIQRDTFDVTGKDIIIALLQSLSLRKEGYDPAFMKTLGLIIVDECHTIGSEVYTQCLQNYCAPYMLGLSATPRRGDGLTTVMHWFLGPTVYSMEAPKDSGVLVRVLPYASSDPAYTTRKMTALGTVDSAALVTQVAGWTPRNEFIVDQIVDLLKDPARQILVLSDRREGQLDVLAAMLEARGAGSSLGSYVGRKGVNKKTHRAKIESAMESRVILGTYMKAKQGLDIPTLNTLIMATPQKDVEQATGRILREPPERRKVQPLIIDIVDSPHPNYVRMSAARKRYYRSRGYTIVQEKGTADEDGTSSDSDNAAPTECLL